MGDAGEPAIVAWSPVPVVTLTVGAASVGVVGDVSVGSVTATGGGVISTGGAGAVFVTTGAAARPGRGR